MNKNRWNNIVFYTTGAILLFAGLERLQVAASGAPALALPDPLLGIPLRAAVIVIGAIELAAAAICLFARGLKLRIAIVVFLSTGYAAFWAGAILTHYHPQGTCLGSLSEPLQLAAGTSGAIISLIPVGLLLGSYSTLFLNREKKVPVKSAPQPVVGPQKMSCPACGGLGIELGLQRRHRRVPLRLDHRRNQIRHRLRRHLPAVLGEELVVLALKIERGGVRGPRLGLQSRGRAGRRLSD